MLPGQKLTGVGELSTNMRCMFYFRHEIFDEFARFGAILEKSAAHIKHNPKIAAIIACLMTAFGKYNFTFGR